MQRGYRMFGGFNHCRPVPLNVVVADATPVGADRPSLADPQRVICKPMQMFLWGAARTLLESNSTTSILAGALLVDVAGYLGFDLRTVCASIERWSGYGRISTPNGPN